MRLAFVLCSIFLCSTSLAQGHDTLFWQKNVLLSEKWNTGAKFQSLCGLRVTEQTWKSIGTRHKHFVAEAYWVKNESFLPNDSLHYRQLAQMMFDIYEIESRIFQSQVNNPDEDLEMLQKAYENRARQKVSEIFGHTFRGTNKDSMQLFRDEIDMQLGQVTRRNEPSLEPTGFQLHLQVNGTGILTAGTFHRYCSRMMGGGAGMEFDYRNLLLSISHSRGGVTVSDSLVKQDFGIYPGNNVQFRQWWYQVGYSFFDYHRLNFSVLAGANSFRLINRSKPSGSLLSRGPVEFNLSISGQVNYSFPPFSHDNQSETQLDIFFRVDYNRYDYLYAMPGSGIGLKIGLQLKLRTLRFPKSEFQ